MDRMLETDYESAWRSAHRAEQAYLDAVKIRASPDDLAAQASYARDRWNAVSAICALGEDAARSVIVMPPLRHRHEALHRAWCDRRNWAGQAEDAAARSELFASLATAHVPGPPAREVVRLYAVEDVQETPTVVSISSRM
jgi:hypothetical protein